MLNDKARTPTAAERQKFHAIVQAVRRAFRESEMVSVPTRAVYWRLEWVDGGGLIEQPGPLPDLDRPLDSRGKQRAARLVRQLKNAARLDLIDGMRVGNGFVWCPAAHPIMTTNTPMYWRSSGHHVVTGMQHQLGAYKTVTV